MRKKSMRRNKYEPIRQIEVHISPEEISKVNEILKESENAEVSENVEVAENLEVSEKAAVTGLGEHPGTCKHPLENTWSFWLQANKSKEWKDNLIELTNFDTVEDYWCLYHYMKSPSELKSGQDYAIFKKGILPMWEDGQNRRGGRWLIMVEKGNHAMLDRIWLDTVLLVIGENFADNDSINGVVVYIRPYSKIGVWTKDFKDQKAVMRIGHELKSVLGIRRLEFTPHNTPKVLYSIS
ncbi:eukaryotic translation initiation factor 4E-1A-like [Plodia interpunctella]|uniref:eukaryotic translation initiation factor 4E-1A-like n=1 Tax=Plodia interpunctella TaxID=58824 RepID=UPI0023689109|nr:eukaryotic translation initiation factor 4E-1A-like [Plodia interpunctella]